MLPPLRHTPHLKPKHDLIVEAHFFGQVVGGVGFEQEDALFCELVLDAGSNWQLILPPKEKTYQTQTCYAGPGQMHAWVHPFDFHFRVNDLSGWPRAVLRVWRFNDASSTSQVLSCGVLTLPKTAGCHELQCPTWTPTGDWKYSALGAYLNSAPRLSNIGKAVSTQQDRCKLFTVGSGRVLVQVNVVLRNFENFNISC